MRSFLPALLIGIVLAVVVFAARCTQDRMHEYETRRHDASSAGTQADPNSAPSDLAEQNLIAQRFPDTLVSPAGYRYRVLQPGDGPKPVAGNRVLAHYEGRLLDGTVFDSSRRHGTPYSFTLMAGRVIRGWDLAVLEMRRGEKRLIVLPSNLAHGTRGAPPAIPARAPLVFEIELVDFE